MIYSLNITSIFLDLKTARVGGVTFEESSVPFAQHQLQENADKY
jgi:hypothetical protein